MLDIILTFKSVYTTDPDKKRSSNTILQSQKEARFVYYTENYPFLQEKNSSFPFFFSSTSRNSDIWKILNMMKIASISGV